MQRRARRRIRCGLGARRDATRERATTQRPPQGNRRGYPPRVAEHRVRALEQPVETHPLLIQLVTQLLDIRV